jgi:hypothetical protein
VGDFIAGLQLIHASVKALSRAHGAPSDYTSLAMTLESLISALREIDSLQCHPSQSSKRLMIQKETESCRQSINAFLSRISKFAALKQPVQSPWTVDGLKSVVNKLQWSLLKPGDVSRFRGEISSRVDSIQMMLLKFQMYVDLLILLKPNHDKDLFPDCKSGGLQLRLKVPMPTQYAQYAQSSRNLTSKKACSIILTRGLIQVMLW